MKQTEIHIELKRFLKIPRIDRLYQKTKETFCKDEPVGHNWEHVCRDIINAVEIGTQEKADMDIVMPAVILHDLGYVTHPSAPELHPANGARECYGFLDEWTTVQRDQISACILKHKGKFPGFEESEPESLEEKVVCDADQLDKFGWIGFLQMMKVYIEHGYKGNSRFKTLEGLAEGMMHQKSMVLYTKTGKHLASLRSEPDFTEIAKKVRRELLPYFVDF